MTTNKLQDVAKKLQLKEKRIFSREELLQELGSVFLEKFLATRKAYQTAKGYKPDAEIPYEQFRGLVAELRAFFWNLSEFRVMGYKPPFTEGLWKAVYAAKIVPIRDKHYPGIQNKINIRKAKDSEDWKIKLRALREGMVNP